MTMDVGTPTTAAIQIAAAFAGPRSSCAFVIPLITHRYLRHLREITLSLERVEFAIIPKGISNRPRRKFRSCQLRVKNDRFGMMCA